MTITMNLKKILAKNIRALQGLHPEMGSNALLAKHCKKINRKLSPRAVGYLLDDSPDRQPKLDTIESIAEAFKVPPWMLLTPDFDAKARGGGAFYPPEVLALAEHILNNRDLFADIFKPTPISDEEMASNGWAAPHAQTTHQPRAEYGAPPRQREFKLKR